MPLDPIIWAEGRIADRHEAAARHRLRSTRRTSRRRSSVASVARRAIRVHLATLLGVSGRRLLRMSAHLRTSR